jgi:GNAT superfamily N-acetyltransferase
MRNFDFPMDLKNAFNHNIGEENWKHYMTFYKNIPAGAGAVFFNGDTAWIGFAATEPEYRGKGSQAAILSARIDEARKRGCKWISVETAEDSPEHDAPSYRNMLRFGFNFMYKRPNFVFEPVKA